MKICPSCNYRNLNTSQQCEKCQHPLDASDTKILTYKDSQLKRPSAIPIVSILFIIIAIGSLWSMYNRSHDTQFAFYTILDFFGPALYLFSAIFMLAGKNIGRFIYLFGFPIALLIQLRQILDYGVSLKWLLPSFIIYLIFLRILTRKNVREYFGDFTMNNKIGIDMKESNNNDPPNNQKLSEPDSSMK